jgi:hypothetical protein
LISTDLLHRRIINIFVIFGLASLVVASEVAANERYSVDGKRLYFNMNIESAEYKLEPSLDWGDAAVFGAYILDFPQITTLVVTGRGGNGRAALRLAEQIEANQLDVVAQGRCSSACTTLLLAGSNRYLADGASLGFHASTVLPAEERDFYEHNRARRGWDDVFDYVPSVYEFGYTDAMQYVTYFLRRGVDLEFTLHSLSIASSEIYEPSREQLFKAGVLTSMTAPPYDF